MSGTTGHSGGKRENAGSGGKRPGAGRPVKRFTLRVNDIILIQRPLCAMELWRVKELSRTVMIFSQVEKSDGPELEEIRIVR